MAGHIIMTFAAPPPTDPSGTAPEDAPATYFYLNPNHHDEVFDVSFSALNEPDRGGWWFALLLGIGWIGLMIGFPSVWLAEAFSLDRATAEAGLRGVEFAMTLYLIAAYWRAYSPRAMRRYWAARRRYQHLKQQGRLIDGTLLTSRVTHDQRLLIIEAEYHVVDPENGALVTGSQQYVTQRLPDYQLPPPGTPVRVLYADEDTHFML
jgi:hypothetical protein